uniref:Uncharacterized protein n=1 Tax=Lotharella oceanica TaxID=641309 RepID=A0A7S2XEL1_9EUKA
MNETTMGHFHRQGSSSGGASSSLDELVNNLEQDQDQTTMRQDLEQGEEEGEDMASGGMMLGALEQETDKGRLPSVLQNVAMKRIDVLKNKILALQKQMDVDTAEMKRLQVFTGMDNTDPDAKASSQNDTSSSSNSSSTDAHHHHRHHRVSSNHTTAAAAAASNKTKTAATSKTAFNATTLNMGLHGKNKKN